MSSTAVLHLIDVDAEPREPGDERRVDGLAAAGAPAGRASGHLLDGCKRERPTTCADGRGATGRAFWCPSRRGGHQGGRQLRSRSWRRRLQLPLRQAGAMCVLCWLAAASTVKID